MLRRRFALLAGVSALFLGGYGLMHIALGSSTDVSSRAVSSNAPQSPPNSEVNTSPQLTFENSGKLVDIVDQPVSLPRQKAIAPPSTGNAGIAQPSGDSKTPPIVLGALALIIVAYARASTGRTRRR
jgi:hypothetical protein